MVPSAEHAPDATSKSQQKHEAQQFTLPPEVTGVADIMRLRRELETLGEYLHQAALRHTPENTVHLPKTSRILNEVIEANKLDILHREQYEQTMAFVAAIEERAPRIHLAFSTDPSASFMVQIVQWFRANVHPDILLQVGLQPNLAAGCVVRTTNKQFDMSLRRHFEKTRAVLIQKLEEGVAA